MTYLRLLAEQYRNLDSTTRLRWGVGIAIVLALAVLFSAANTRIAYLSKLRTARERDVAEMLILRQRYQIANAGAQKLANRLAATRPDDSPAKLIDEIGIKGKNSQIKPVKGDEQPGFVEDAAEVKLDGLTANETVNLLYRLEKGSKPVIIKKALLKARFDDPSRLDLTLTIALLKAAPTGPR
ncbi:general secretion pathway protein GspM [Geobacter sp. AOG1]|uniref:general secretion pathway protein GspM n=1 Tax=Geobacter sp. AOG1 TaxID=1566346 RepID=UPI001CC56985|nr:general secretion pathway protein GspM [Geobacter sp. AOG1]GFE57252.1 type II secretion system protein GspM [Geobacter sp. AOG1]